jgi:DNA-binding NtrC family response regulator
MIRQINVKAYAEDGWLLNAQAQFYPVEDKTMNVKAGRLLVVDDDPLVLQIAAQSACAAGLEFMGRLNANDFERVLIEFWPTIVITDIVMPERDGLELLSVLAAHRFRGQVIIVSGFETRYLKMARTIACFRGLNVTAALPKPLNADAILLSLAA